jgi:hypothetical protein
MWSALVLLILLGMVGFGMWALIPRWNGVPPTASRPRWIRKALQSTALRPGETVYDLGAGDGRVLTIAAHEFDARSVGYEIEPLHCIAAWIRALFHGVLPAVTIRRQDLFKADLAHADVVYLYLNPVFVEKLRPLLESQTRPGTRIVSLDFPIESWEPTHVDIGHLIFTYQIPPQLGSVESYLRKYLTLPVDPDMITLGEDCAHTT